MTSIHQPHHMYVDTAIRFRDPFLVSKKDLTPPIIKPTGHEHSTASWPSHTGYQGAARPPTPPPEMTGIQPQPKQSYYPQEHGHHYGDYLPPQLAYRAPVAPYSSQEVKAEFSRPATDSHVNGRASPVRKIEPSNDYAASRRASQANAIAPNFQIPRSVNDSGGSLSELAAQITCLFWFESSEVLQQVEESSSPIQPSRPLSADAKPTTGFRKWATTILSTTMVAQNVVVLALLFIYRLKKLNPSVKGKPGSEYRLLTVALMLGNKFLDDNTYTNKTWAEVSGINVAEVHIMEVEFLSNMKYCLFTSEQDWATWQSLLGKFAAFFDRASRPVPLAPVLPPASSLHLPLALPSPPVSNQASPPFAQEFSQNRHIYSSAAGPHGPTPAPSPLGNYHANTAESKKRSHENDVTEPPAKRVANGFHNYTSPHRYSTLPPQQIQTQPVPRLTLPSLAIPTSQPSSNGYSQQLPSLNMPPRAMAMSYPATTSNGQGASISAPAGAPQLQPQPQYASRHQSQYAGSGPTSPSSAAPQSATALHPTSQISPTYCLQQRNSPYRPIHDFSTLLYPPPSSATQGRPANVELNRMQYQPLGKATQHTGRLPYVAQNLWLDGNQPQEMTPIHQWPGFQQLPLRPVPQPQSPV